MFTLNERCEVDRNILKWDYIRYGPSEISTIKFPNAQTYINIPRNESVNSVLDSRLDLIFDVLHFCYR